jgi:2-(S-pantetheinyl)-carbapenam-3-carboxylate methyltransferase
MRKHEIYFNEFNLLMGSGGIVYLPLVSGILAACAKNSPEIRKNAQFMPYIFLPDTASNIIEQYNEPSVACFSISMWNEQLSLEVAGSLNKRFPDCLIMFGGAQCPHEPTDYMNKYQFIDVCVRAEGEHAFIGILERILGGTRDFEGVANTSYREGDSVKINYNIPAFERSLDEFPSPYLTGEFDYLLDKNDHGYQAIIETNRGCPFMCTFCYWGKGGNNRKYRFKSLDTVYEEIEYLGKKGVTYIFNADSNFGMHKRDYDIALKLVETKTKLGFPEKFRTCWGKNTSERIFRIASLLHYHELDKGVTLARQSNNTEVLSNIKRDNIKLSAYSALEDHFNTLNVPVYAELILGLPGESIDSWKRGIDELLETGLNNQLFVYQAEVYPNTELGSKKYQDKYKIKTKKIALNEIHCSPRPEGWTTEFQKIVIQNYSMTTNDWRYMTKFSVITMLLHSMKLGYFILAYTHKRIEIKYSEIIELILNAPTEFLSTISSYIDQYLDDLVEGKGRGILAVEYSEVYLDIEEVLFLKATENIDKIFSEILQILKSKFPKPLHEELEEVVLFQKTLIPFNKENEDSISVEFKYNIPDYCLGFYRNLDIEIKESPNTLNIVRPGFENSIEFTKYKVIYARKSGTILYASDLEIKLNQKAQTTFKIEAFDTEETFKVSLFDKNGVKKHSKFNSLEAKS